MKKADLHTHTLVSDGKLSPVELVKEAHRKGLGYLSITDHDAIEGYTQALHMAQTLGLTLIPGSEITGDYKGAETHVLAYAFDVEHEKLHHRLLSQRKTRLERAEEMTMRLRKLGFDVEFDEVLAESKAGVIGRPHIASLMVRKRYANSTNEVFMRYIGNHAPAYVKFEHPPVEEVISWIHEAGGVAIMAHAGYSHAITEWPVFVEMGVDGFEYIHPSHPYMLQKQINDFCKQRNLMVTGGSDYHGFKQHDLVNFGVVTVHPNLAQQLLEVQSNT